MGAKDRTPEKQRTDMFKTMDDACNKMQDDEPTKPALHKVGDKIMGFGIHYPVSGTITVVRWHIIDLEWEYTVKNDDGYEGKIREGKILPFDQVIWEEVEAMWNDYLDLMKKAEKIELECRILLRRS